MNNNEDLKNKHKRFMMEAIKEAHKALKINEVPVGAVIVKDGLIISRGHNQKETKNDPTGHAEIIAIKKACAKLSSWRLNDCEMYVTLEPCTMCAGAIIQSRIKNLYIGTKDSKAGACGSVINVLTVNQFNHKVIVEYDILKDRCFKILNDFFKKLRANK